MCINGIYLAGNYTPIGATINLLLTLNALNAIDYCVGLPPSPFLGNFSYSIFLGA